MKVNCCLLGANLMPGLGLAFVQQPCPPSPLSLGKFPALKPICSVQSPSLQSICTRWSARKYPDLFTRPARFNHHIIRTRFKPNFQTSQQKGRRVPLALQSRVHAEIERLISEGHVRRIHTCPDDRFISPIVITVKKDGTINLELDFVFEITPPTAHSCYAVRQSCHSLLRTSFTQLFSVSPTLTTNTMRSPFKLFSSWTRRSRRIDPPSDSTDDPVVDITASSPEPTTTLAPVSPSAPLSPFLSLTSAVSQFPTVTPPVPVLPVAKPISHPAPPPPVSSLPVLKKATLSAIVVAVDAHHSRTPHTNSDTNTDSSLCVSQFSPDIIKVLTATDTELQAVMQAVTSRSPAHRNALTEYWRSLLDDLHIIDGCLFLEVKIVIPLALREAVLT